MLNKDLVIPCLLCSFSYEKPGENAHTYRHTLCGGFFCCLFVCLFVCLFLSLYGCFIQMVGDLGRW